MTEAEWLACTDPMPMLEFLQNKPSDRKLRLFAVACCWSILPFSTDERHRKVIEVVERFADGEATNEELDSAWTACRDTPGEAHRAARAAAAMAATRTSGVRSVARAVALANGEDAQATADSVQVNLLHDIFCNPFRPITFDPAWLTWHEDLLVSMAQQMYDSRDFNDMPVLGDAMEEAGCQDQDILDHCRSRGEHVRGCWVVDLVLGKS
ncbi:MAG TPA: hypothetical protein VH575_16290 [Gemmataceae bacterium]